jgi:hypothetical protein
MPAFRFGSINTARLTMPGLWIALTTSWKSGGSGRSARTGSSPGEKRAMRLVEKFGKSIGQIRSREFESIISQYGDTACMHHAIGAMLHRHGLGITGLAVGYVDSATDRRIKGERYEFSAGYGAYLHPWRGLALHACHGVGYSRCHRIEHNSHAGQPAD